MEKAPDPQKPAPAAIPASVADDPRRSFSQLAWLVALGWLGTNLGINVTDLPLKLTLKEGLGLTATSLSVFFAIATFTNYIKPLAGILVDSVPLFGTRRRWYLLLSLFGTGCLW